MANDTPPLNRHPFFRPLWRRIVVIAIPAAWTAFELVTGSPGWALLFGALAVYGFWNLFVIWQGDAPPPE